MAVFLFLKQVVDMFYQYRILDYGMVVFGVVLLLVKGYREKIYLHLREFLNPADFIIIALAAVYAGAFLRYPAAYGNFFKIESAFLLYFLGRVYGNEIMKHGRMLAGASYIAVYLNFFYRFYQFGFRFTINPGEEDLLNRGGLYYYKTDLAVGMIIAVLFIYMFSEIKWLKWFTIIPVCGYMVFYSGARMQQFVMIGIYLLLLLCEIEKKTDRQMILNDVCAKVLSVIMLVVVAAFFVLIEVFPFERYGEQIALTTDWATSWIEKLMHSRQAVWWGILQYFSEQTLGSKLFGIDLMTEYLHNSVGVRAHSMYIKQIYATGYTGCLLLLIFVIVILKKLAAQEDRKLFYVTAGLWVMFLGTGLSIESMELTQMSWFPFLFAGVLLASVGKAENVS